MAFGAAALRTETLLHFFLSLSLFPWTPPYGGPFYVCLNLDCFVVRCVVDCHLVDVAFWLCLDASRSISFLFYFSPVYYDDYLP